MSLVNQEKLNYFAQQLYAKIKANFDSKNSAATAETNAKEYADGLNTQMDTRVDALETTVGNAESGLVKDVAVLKGDKSVEGSVQFQVAQIVAGADASYDTLKEIADWIMSDQTGAAKMANDIKANADAITDLETLVGTIPAEATATDIVGYIAEYVQAQLTASDLSQYAKAEDFNALKDVVGDGTKGLVKGLADVTTKATANETAIGVLNGADTVEGSVAKAVKNAKEYTDTKDLAMSTRVDDIEAGMKPYVESVKEEYIEDFNFISNLPYEFCDMNFSDGLDLGGCSLMFNNELHIIGSSINENSNKHYKYNFDSKEWTSVSTLPLSIENAGFNPVMKDTIIEYKNEMYWFIGNTYYKFNNTTQEWEEVNNSTFNFDGIYPLPLVYRDELYVLLITSSNGNTKSLKKYNDTDKTWSTVVSFDNNFASYDYTMAKVFNDEIHILGLSSSDNVIHYKYDGSTLIEVDNNLSKDCINRFYASLQVYNDKLYLYDFSGYYEYNGSAWNDKIQYTNLLKDTVVYNNSLYAIGFKNNVTTENTGFSNNLYKLEKINNTITNKLSDTNTDDEVPTAKLVYESITDAVAQATESISKGGSLVNNVISTKAGTITVTKGENTQDVAIKGVVVNPTYDSDTRTITLPYADGTESLVISLGKDIFVDPNADNKYNTATGNIELYLNDGSMSYETVYALADTPANDDKIIRLNSNATYYDANDIYYIQNYIEGQGPTGNITLDNTVTAENFDEKVAAGNLWVLNEAVNHVYPNVTSLYMKKEDGSRTEIPITTSLLDTLNSLFTTATGEIQFGFMKSTMISIPASDLVDIYTGETSADGSTTVSVSADNKITASVNVSADAGNKLVKKADGLYVDAVAQADFDALDKQVNGVQATITLKENGTVTAEAATYTYNENDKFFINDLTEPVSQTYNQYQYGMENASRYIVITGEDGVVKRLTDAEGRLTTTETGIETNAEAITQLRADVDTNIASLEDVHIDATAENKYDNTTGNINLYLNDGKVYEEIDYYYNGSDWYKLGSNATYNSGSYATINKETNTINHDVTVTEENFADMVAAGLWTYGSPLGNYPKVKTIKVVDSNGNVDYYNSKETSYYDLVQEFEVRHDRETCTLYLLIKDESTKIEVPITELKTAIENIATNSEAIGVLNGADTVEGSVAKALKDAKTYADGLAVNYATAEQGNKADAAAAAIGVETDTENSVTATGIYARLESLESVMGTASVKDDHGNVVTPATGVQKQIEDLQASQNEIITEAQIDEMINGLA